MEEQFHGYCKFLKDKDWIRSTRNLAFYLGVLQ
jgi:hypothetical protein